MCCHTITLTYSLLQHMIDFLFNCLPLSTFLVNKTQARIAVSLHITGMSDTELKFTRVMKLEAVWFSNKK